MILIFETPAAYSVNVDATLSGESASFSPDNAAADTQAGTTTARTGHGIRERPCDDPEYVPVVVQGSGKYQVTTSIPVQVAPNNYS
jgi:hypothetical protein